MCVVAEGEGTNQCSTDSDCQTPPPTCPTDCGQPASRISDGKGGYISCDATAACPVSVPTEAPSTNPGGPGDGLGCATHDCSGNKVGGGSSTQAVLGASTGPQVLGLSTTSGEESFLPQWLQLFGALTSGGLGLIFFKKNG
jgi:hypothetical protein